MGLEGDKQQDLYERTEDDVLEGVRYVATIIYDGEVVARVSASGIESLEYELHKLESAETKLIEDIHEERLESGYYDRDYDEDNKDSKILSSL